MTDAAVDDPRLWRLLADEIFRRARRRIRIGVMHPLRFAGATPERILAAPPDIGPAEAAVAQQFYTGRYPLGGQVVHAASSPFAPSVGDAAFRTELHGFAWLRHFRAAGTDLAAANARSLALDWLRHWGNSIGGEAWAPEVAGRRIVSWLRHSATLLQGAELGFYRAFLRSLAMQVRFLRAMAPDMPPGPARLEVRIALAFAALSLPASPARLARTSHDLGIEIERQVFPDGGHISRNPARILDLLAELLPLRQTYATQAETPPQALLAAIDRMFPALRFFLHGDATLARFNGAGATDHRLLVAVLRHDEAEGAVLRAAPHSGYQRLACGGTTAICDTGPPPPPAFAREAHAGTLAFEFSAGDACYVVNVGAAAPVDWQPLARSTAAHSTAIIADQSSARFSHTKRTEDLLGAPLVAGPGHVAVSRQDGAGGQAFRASHDGYVRRFGVIHERSLALTDDGSELTGIDRFLASGDGAARPGALRFHLHPDIAAARDSDGRLLLAAPDGGRWAFSNDGPEATVEESIFFADPSGSRKTLQIVIDFDTATHPEISWRFVRLAKATHPA